MICIDWKTDDPLKSKAKSEWDVAIVFPRINQSRVRAEGVLVSSVTAGTILSQFTTWRTFYGFCARASRLPLFNWTCETRENSLTVQYQFIFNFMQNKGAIQLNANDRIDSIKIKQLSSIIFYLFFFFFFCKLRDKLRNSEFFYLFWILVNA